MSKLRPFLLLVSLVGAILATTSVQALGLLLAPHKVSDLVILTTAGVSESCPGGGRPVTNRIMPDGTYQPFEIPEGRVLILTDISVRHRAPSPPLTSMKALRYVMRYEGGAEVLEDSLLVGPGTEGTAGVSVGAKTLSTPMIPVEPGVRMCVVGPDEDPGPVFLYGFLVREIESFLGN